MPCRRSLYVTSRHRKELLNLTPLVTIRLQQSAVKEKIALAGGASNKSGPANDKRNALRAELDSIRGQQSSSKSTRTKIRDQLQVLQDGIQKKVYTSEFEHIRL